MESVPVQDLALLIRRALVIANPAARRGRALANVARHEIERAGVACDVVLTEQPGHGAEIALARHRDYDAVFALGGDGTVMEVAGALAGSDRPVGVLAGGTGNLVARALGIPLRIRDAVPALLQGEQLVMDMGRLDSGRRFAIAAGVGIDAAMVRDTPPWLKRRLGVLAYTIMGAWAAIRAVLFKQSFHARLVVDGRVFERRAAAVMVANFGAVLGNRLTLGPEIRADDGLLDGCMFAPDTLRDAVRIAWRMLRKDFSSDPCMVYCRGRTLRLETDPPLQVQADGELLSLTPVTIVVDPRAARLLVPRAQVQTILPS
jgi:YegS/Rv2252/BmrU family lipid kinase